MTVATYQDVAARVGRPLTTLERGRVEAALEDIEVEIKRLAPDRLTTASWKDAVISVECSAAIRAARIPDALTQLSPDIESTGVQTPFIQGSVYLRRSERRTLGLKNTASVAGAPNPDLEIPKLPTRDDWWDSGPWGW